MKHLMTLLALVVAVTAGAQGTTIHEYPWNPDWNNDNFVGSSDLTGFLSAFGSEFGNPPEPCDYDGSSFEEWLFGINDGTIILDSIFVEFELEDVSSYFVSGCPDPIIDTLVYADAFMIDDITLQANGGWLAQNNANGSWFWIEHYFITANGTYGMVLANQALNQNGFTQDGFFGGYWVQTTSLLPLPSTWIIDEEGIDLSEALWNSSDPWFSYANYLHILPYWHYAE